MFRKVSLFLVIIFSCNTEKSVPLAPSKLKIDKYYGISVKDPYRNLENLEDAIVVNWLKKQEAYSNSILSTIPNRNNFLEKQKSYDKKEGTNISKTRITNDGVYFYLKQTSLEETPKLYYRDSLESKDEIVLYDPANYKVNSGFKYKINYFKPNWGDTKIAISLAKEGEEVSELIIVDVTSKDISPDVITNANPKALGGISWLPDNSGFIYQHIPLLNITEREFMLNTKSVVYRLGGDPTKLKDIFSKESCPELDIKEEDYPVVQYESNKDSYLFGILDGDSSYKDTYYASIKGINKESLNWNLLFSKEDKVKDFILRGDDIFFTTAKNASNFKICKTSLKRPNFQQPLILVAEKEKSVILDFEIVKDDIYFTTLKNGVESKLFVLTEDLIEKEIQLPKPSGGSYLKSNGVDLYVSMRGWTIPYCLYKYDIKEKVFQKADLLLENSNSKFKDLIVEEIEIKSHDDTILPISIIHKRGLKKDGNNSTLILGYGSYGASFTPFFSIPLLTWVTEGGVLVIPHVRGGGEKGDLWHKAGYKVSKPNTWKDAISCTEYLIKQGYTSKRKTVIYGVSAGGIMVGRSITERPDLFAVALADVPAMNMIRSEIQPNGPNSIKEFGSIKDSIEFRALLEMDSYHNIKENAAYPATYITTGIKDSRVVAWDPAKFAARLQAANTSGKPILLSVDFNSGHGVNYTKSKYYKDMADALSFAFWQTGHPDYQP
ncbi:prolyl oligopeptidase family serine peptidase [Aquimarina sp. 2201CG14-23]|uniref:prolyl oligopeptidase family serine peptidase n=1 Tax=Aquimarina mycalae TaxID=3040073 RepID=UPI002477CF8A|nr:prolyl oligopeptidase family serine peptidase [Aquimarina sp. 2201CG14-23]MDH7446085.1 prolyl oligopeptidase family serine peptidase [Aquimarina sp. 2201CG14-23]